MKQSMHGPKHAAHAAHHRWVLPAILSLATALATMGPRASGESPDAARPSAADDIPVVTKPGVGEVPARGQVRPGMAAPDFALPDLDGETRRLSDYAGAGKIVVIEWYNPTCVYIVKYHETHPTMRDLRARFGAEQGVVWLAVNSGSIESGTADRALNRERAAVQGIEHPILFDSDGVVGRLYGAKVTPQFFVLDEEGVVRYIGAIDNMPTGDGVGDTNYVERALEAITQGVVVDRSIVRPHGCAVKYGE